MWARVNGFVAGDKNNKKTNKNKNKQNHPMQQLTEPHYVTSPGEAPTPIHIVCLWASECVYGGQWKRSDPKRGPPVSPDISCGRTCFRWK
eukprot:NODE_3878_length_514_cov_28.251613_g3306_i0.p1 GENE.NODE_3878_length_514_cov_28.251613_g3306_i0~~NODE_3878_length_514_cov_28.251613_g3306_i0.p1  ORF type:complete len:90 (-),score=12.18 NODE_3878_length_514_cov_28.251613_g3306_i0:59-328(-)